MKHIVLSIIFSFLFSLIESQNIANTKWKTFNTGLSDTVHIDIYSDTIFQYMHPDTMLAISLYTQKSDTIELIDVGGTFACLPVDTGIYRILIIGDTMTIDYINDPCFSRNLVYSGAKLWRVDIPSGITSFSEEIKFKLYPNPSDGFISIETIYPGKIIILNAFGQVVVQKEVYDFNSNIVLHLNSGSYIVKYQSEKLIATQKLIIR